MRNTHGMAKSKLLKVMEMSGVVGVSAILGRL